MTPHVSVVIPTYDRPEQLRQCLGALARPAAGTPPFEVVVADDGSPRPVEPGPEAAALDLTVLRCEHRGPAAARNAGAAAARGEALAFTDDDCLPDPGWVAAMARRLDAEPDALVGGRTVNALPHRPCAEASQALLDFLYRFQHARDDRTAFFASNNLALTAQTFGVLGGFDTSFPLAAGEDRDLCHRWLLGGGRLVTAPEALVRHAHDLRLPGFLRQHFRYGRGAHRFHRLRATRGESFPAPRAAFYRELLRAGFAGRGTAAGARTASLLVLSQAANAAGFAVEAARALRRRDAPGGPSDG